jgi:hypothetical protein
MHHLERKLKQLIQILKKNGIDIGKDGNAKKKTKDKFMKSICVLKLLEIF